MRPSFNNVDFISTNFSSPDFIFLLGDYSGHNFYQIPKEELFESTKIVFEKIRQNFPKTFIVPVLGNHECFPLSFLDFDEPNNFIYKNIFPLFEQFIGKKQVDQLKQKYFYELEYNQFNIKIIVINSQLFDMLNSQIHLQKDFIFNLFENLSFSLFESENQGQKVFILQHYPITSYMSISEFNKAFKIIYYRFRKTIIGFFGGHSHKDQLRFLLDDKNESFLVNFISPSLTTYESYRPSFRIYEYLNNQMYDYYQYNMDIDYYNELARNQNIYELQYQLSYSFKKEYQVQNFGKKEMTKLRNILLDTQRNSTELQNYLKNYQSLSTQKLTKNLKQQILCEVLDDQEVQTKCVLIPFIKEIHPYLGMLLFRFMMISKVLVNNNL